MTSRRRTKRWTSAAHQFESSSSSSGDESKERFQNYRSSDSSPDWTALKEIDQVYDKLRERLKQFEAKLDSQQRARKRIKMADSSSGKRSKKGKQPQSERELTVAVFGDPLSDISSRESSCDRSPMEDQLPEVSTTTASSSKIPFMKVSSSNSGIKIKICPAQPLKVRGGGRPNILLPPWSVKKEPTVQPTPGNEPKIKSPESTAATITKASTSKTKKTVPIEKKKPDKGTSLMKPVNKVPPKLRRSSPPEVRAKPSASQKSSDTPTIKVKAGAACLKNNTRLVSKDGFLSLSSNKPQSLASTISTPTRINRSVSCPSNINRAKLPKRIQEALDYLERSPVMNLPKISPLGPAPSKPPSSKSSKSSKPPAADLRRVSSFSALPSTSGQSLLPKPPVLRPVPLPEAAPLSESSSSPNSSVLSSPGPVINFEESESDDDDRLSEEATAEEARILNDASERPERVRKLWFDICTKRRPIHSVDSIVKWDDMDGMLTCIVRWSLDSEEKDPLPYEVVRELYPQQLIAFFQSRLCWVRDHGKNKKLPNNGIAPRSEY